MAKKNHAKLMPDEFKKKAEAIIARIQKARDELHDLIDTYRDIGEDCDEALRSFHDGLESLSRDL